MFARDSIILVVDDSATTRVEIRRELESLGYFNIREAEDGNDAYAKMAAATKKIPFSLVIADWNMPGMNGLELLKKIRSRPEWINLPFIMLTAESAVEQVATAISNNVSGYIVKPMGKGALKLKLEAVWKRYSGDS